MKTYGYRIVLLLTAALFLCGGSALAQVAQDIIVDGVNDFNVANLIESEPGDTQFTEVDLVDLSVTNNANNLFVGYGYDKGVWGSNQIGIAIEVGTADGGSTDPWSRQLDWSTAVNKPDFVVYCNLDNNWQAGYRWDGAAWVEFVTQGPGALNWVADTTFGEFAILLATLGVGTGDAVGVEVWTTQDNVQRGPFDMFANDAVQTSTPGGTIFAPVPAPQPTIFHPFTILAAADAEPPVIDTVRPTAHPIATGLDVVFNEPVDQTTAETAGNYALDNMGAIAVTAAVRDAVDLNVVHLTLAAPMGAQASLYDLTVANVEDLAGNPIATGSGDEACFMVKELVFRGLFSFFLQNNSSPPDAFSVEGDLAPLTFGALCDTGNMADTGTDDIWEFSGLFMVVGDCGTGTASETLEWKFVHNCATYEGLAGNRTHTLDLTNGATDVLEFWWNDEDPSNFLTKAVDVEFFVDMNASGMAMGDTVSINGNVAPLTNDVPSVTRLVDDGTGNDATAGDGIYSTVVRFDVGAAKNVLYKFLLNSTYECFGQDDRHVYVNEDVFGIVGSPEGPLTLPVAVYDFCATTWAPVEVVFSVNMKHTEWHDIAPTDVVSLRGTPSNTAPPVLDWDTPGLNVLLDDGVAPDAVAGDLIYTCSVVFPDSSDSFTEYKYLVNDAYECILGNRTFWIDPTNFDDLGNPQVLGTDKWVSCDVSGVPDLGEGLGLAQNHPNPFNPSTTIRFNLPGDGKAVLRVYDARGGLVRTLRNEHMVAGNHSVVWNGRDHRGAGVASGVYFYRLDAAGTALTRRMLLLK
jgi:hypothetical protein